MHLTLFKPIDFLFILSNRGVSGYLENLNSIQIRIHLGGFLSENYLLMLTGYPIINDTDPDNALSDPFKIRSKSIYVYKPVGYPIIYPLRYPLRISVSIQKKYYF